MKTPDSIAVLELDRPEVSAAQREHEGRHAPSSNGDSQRDTTATSASRASLKVHAKHLERQAIVYIRQSSPQQVLQNRESRERQYALVERAVELGWPRQRVRVIDDDQGQSGKSAETRNGFQEILVDVSLDQVGLVLGLEMSRMSRSCRDAYQLMEVCGVFCTLLADFDGVYDPTDVNDRLLLGLKATISEVELHTMRNRLLLGKLNKAQRGELFSHLPMGYVRTPSGEVALDPDEQVQAAIRLVFIKFAELKSINAVLRYLARTDVRLPVRPHGGPSRGQLTWRRPSQSMLRSLLRHPMYAGAYCYGRHRVDPRRAHSGRPGSGLRRVAPEEAHVLLRDRLPAYISWEQFQENQRQMAENRSQYDTRGVPRRGVALLAGLLACGRCGYRLRVSYGSSAQPRYMCSAHQWLHGLSACQSLEGSTLDGLVTRQVLRALEPAAIELSLLAGASLEQERARQQAQWQLRLERARYESQRAARQYHAVEPENRLVARQLERAWEQALTAQRELEEQYARWLHGAPSQVTAQEKARIQQLAHEIPALWNAPGTSDADRKTITRHLIEQIVVNVQDASEIVQVTIHWAGGFESQHQFQRRVASYEQLADFNRLLERVAELHVAGHSRAEIAEQLQADGFRSPRGGESFSLSAVSRFLSRLRARQAAAQSAASSTCQVGTSATLVAHEWWPTDLAHVLDTPLSTIHAWRRRGWIRARKCHGWPDRWVCYADHSELQRLQQLRDYQRPVPHQPYPAALTTPFYKSDP